MTSRLDASYAVVRKTGIPDGWTERRLSDLIRIVSGGTPDRNESAYWRDGGIPWITPTDLTANNNKYISSGAEHISEAGLTKSNARLVPVDSIIFSTRGTVGNLAMAGVPLTTNQSCEVLVPRDESVCSEFLYYLLNYGMFAFHRLAGGTTFGAITRREISRVWLAMPEPDEQAAIARVLDAVDAAIERAWDALSRARDAERALIEDAFDRIDSEKRRLGEFATDVRYGTSQASSDRGWGNPVLRIPNVVGDQLSLDDLAYVELRPVDVERLALNDGDLLLVRTNGNPNYVGRSAVFRTPDERTWVYASYLIRVRLTDEILPEYINVFLSSERGRRELLRRVTTSAGNHNINSNSIRLLSIPVPRDPSVQEDLFRLAEASRQLAGSLLNKVAALETLKNTLMHDLLTGTMRVEPKLFKELNAS